MASLANLISHCIAGLDDVPWRLSPLKHLRRRFHLFLVVPLSCFFGWWMLQSLNHLYQTTCRPRFNIICRHSNKESTQVVFQHYTRDLQINAVCKRDIYILSRETTFPIVVVFAKWTGRPVRPQPNKVRLYTRLNTRMNCKWNFCVQCTAECKRGCRGTDGEELFYETQLSGGSDVQHLANREDRAK